MCLQCCTQWQILYYIFQFQPPVGTNNQAPRLVSNSPRHSISPVSSPLPAGSPNPNGVIKFALGPLPAFDEFGLKILSHREPTIDRFDKNGTIVIEIYKSDPNARIVYHLIRDPSEDWHSKVRLLNIYHK